MTTTRSLRDDARSRRRFLKMAVLGSAAAIASVAMPGGAEAAPKRKKRAVRETPLGPVAPESKDPVATEIARQKSSTSDLLKTIRDYELPSGSELAFAFVPMRAPKRPRGGGSTTSSGGAR